MLPSTFVTDIGRCFNFVTPCSPFLELAPSFIFDGFLAPIDLNKEAEEEGGRGGKSENEDEDWCANQANELEVGGIKTWKV